MFPTDCTPSLQRCSRRRAWINQAHSVGDSEKGRGMGFCTSCSTRLADGVETCPACRHPVAAEASSGQATAPPGAGPSAMPASPGPPAPASGWQQAGELFDVGTRIVARLLVSLLWLGVTIAGFGSGMWFIGVLGILYLVYLWAFRGRLLIY